MVLMLIPVLLMPHLIMKPRADPRSWLLQTAELRRGCLTASTHALYVTTAACDYQIRTRGVYF